jgi:hypothetical protein
VIPLPEFSVFNIVINFSVMTMCLSPFPVTFFKKENKTKEKSHCQLPTTVEILTGNSCGMNFKFWLGSVLLENGESLHKPCYCERWLHKKLHFFSSDRRTAGSWQQ